MATETISARNHGARLVPFLLAVWSVTLILAIDAAPAAATFPGANGKIAFGKTPPGLMFSFDIFGVNPDGSGLTNLTKTHGNFMSPSYSADGKRIVLAAPQNSGLKIFVMNADGSGLTELNQPSGGVDGSSPAFSPDGSKIVYSQGGSILLMNADGSGQTPLTDDSDDHPSFSPDGQRIVFDRAGEIWVMNRNGSGQTNLSNTGGLLNPDFDDSNPSFSPDGQRIVFERDDTDPNTFDTTFEIWVMNANGSAQARVGSLTGVDPVFSPDGRKIAYQSFDSLGIDTMNTDGSGVLPADVGGGFEPDWQPVSGAGNANKCSKKKKKHKRRAVTAKKHKKHGCKKKKKK